MKQDWVEKIRSEFVTAVIQAQGKKEIIETVMEFWRNISLGENAPQNLVEIALEKITLLRDENISDSTVVFMLVDVNDMVTQKMSYSAILQHLDTSGLDVPDYFCPKEDEWE